VTHCSDDDLVLHYYRDPEAATHVAAHLAVCGDCGERYEEVAEALTMVAFAPTPDRGDHYGRELWLRLEPRVPVRQPFWRTSWFRPLALAAAAMVLLIAGFTVGRLTPPPPDGTSAGTPIDAAASRRVLLMSVVDHLERSDRVLTDIMNAASDSDISAEQQWATDLVADNRFFRQDAADSNEASLAAVLDELERALLDIVHSPSQVTPADLEKIHRRLDSAALLFKVRVLGDELRHRQQQPEPDSDSPTVPSRIS
jgi:hypothetical protein